MSVNGIIRISVLAVVTLLLWSAPLSAQYTLVLKNGRRITVQSYREEGGMIKFQGLGGEIGVGRDQIQSIVKAGEREGQGFVLPGSKKAPAETATKSQEEKKAVGTGPEAETKAKGKTEGPSQTKEKVLTPEEAAAEEKAKAEKEYQNRVKQLTEQIKAARERYAIATRGSASPEPGLLTTDEAIKARREDLISRLRDVQHNPGGPSDAGGVKMLTPSPFSGVPPSTTELRPGEAAPHVDTPVQSYTGKERELSDMRNQINQLEKQRERLIEEMKQKNLDTGSLFLE
jgi:hypothetical protein